MGPGDRELFPAMAGGFSRPDAVPAPVPEAHFGRAFAEPVRSEEFARCCLSEDAGEAAGYALLRRAFSQEAGGFVVWVEELCVRPASRGRGLGSGFLGWLPGRLPAALCRLKREPENARAAELSRRWGCRELPCRQMARD